MVADVSAPGDVALVCPDTLAEALADAPVLAPAAISIDRCSLFVACR
jgi:hypothetical protein